MAGPSESKRARGRALSICRINIREYGPEGVIGVWWQVVIGVVSGLVVVYAVLLTFLWRASRHGPDAMTLREALRLLPDVVRLLHRLARDHELPRGVRVRLAILLLYLASPIDLIPDFIPVLGYADDAIVVALALRSVVRTAGPDALTRHWPGTPEGLQAVMRLAGITRLELP
jgi:uncharacterized membrane protein YkvA (DUF1232 family)